MASLAELWQALFPAAQPVASLDEAAGERMVSWVRVLKARVPAFDGLEPGDLALVASSALEIVAPAPGDVGTLADALVRAKVAAALLVEPLEAAGSPADPSAEALAARLVAAGVPVFRLVGAQPVELERSIIGYLVNSRAELDRQAAVLEVRLERLALGSGDVVALVAAIGAFLGRAVALEGRRGGALALHAPTDVPEAAAAVAAYHARARAVALRVPLPAGPGGGESTGSLALLGERPVTELERVVLERTAGLVALELSRDESVRRARDDARRGAALPAAGPPWLMLVARQAPPGETGSLEQREEARRDVRLLAPARRLGLRGDAESLELRVILAAPVRDPTASSRDGAGLDPSALDLAGRVAGLLGRGVAVSRPFTSVAERPAAEAEARATLEAAEVLDEPPIVARADRLPVYRLLGNLHNVPDGARQARALLEPIMTGSPATVRERLATLRAVLERPGLAEAAAILGVHRNTVAYRVRRIEALAGWQLDDPELRFPLALALRLVQTEQG